MKIIIFLIVVAPNSVFALKFSDILEGKNYQVSKSFASELRTELFCFNMELKEVIQKEAQEVEEY